MKQLTGSDKDQCVPLAEKVGKHDGKGTDRTQSCGKASAHDAHVQGKHTEVISQHIENPTKQHSFGCQGRITIVSEKSCKHLVEQKCGNHELDWQEVTLSQRQQTLLCAEQRK